jgi:hypothetical protein
MRKCFLGEFMRNKFFRSILVAGLLINLLSQANAGFIVGGTYENEAGRKWKYVGSFELAGGPRWDATDVYGNSLFTPLNGQEAAASIFGLPIEDLAVSAFANMTKVTFDLIQEGQDVVNHLAWYDGNIGAVSILAEDIVADKNNDGTYQGDINIGDVSAYVNDRAWDYDPDYGDARYEYNINYVFEAVPEPSMLGLFSLVLCGLGALRLKRHMLRPINFST